MKTLTSSTDTSAIYEFTHGTAMRVVSYTKPEREEAVPDFEAMAAAEHNDWLAWLGATE